MIGCFFNRTMEILFSDIIKHMENINARDIK